MSLHSAMNRVRINELEAERDRLRADRDRLRAENARLRDDASEARARMESIAKRPARFSFCAAALEEALLRFGKPRIFNTDQGSTFTAEAFAGKLAAAGVAISMDGRGRFMDNILAHRYFKWVN